MKKIIFLLVLLVLRFNAFAQTTTFNYTGAVQTYTVPAGATSIIVDVQGAAGGGTNGYDTYQSQGGAGGRVQATIAVTPGHVLDITVGSKGLNTGAGGYCGGGTDALFSASWPGAGGGGYSGITDNTSSTLLVVAGGGGGGGGNTAVADGGGKGGGTCSACAAGNGLSDGCTIGGLGGAASGGAGEAACSGDAAGGAGASLTGGSKSAGDGSGGGGGGYFGGGAGSEGGGGGGGSSYGNSTFATGASYTSGYNTGNGIVTISAITTPGCTPTCMYPSTVCSGGYGVYSLSLTGAAGTSLNDATTCTGTGYSNNISQNVTLARGGTYTTTFGNNTSGSEMSCQLWIDFNNDGIFETTESVGGGLYLTAITTQSFSIPTYASPGTYRFRVIAGYTGGLCINYYWCYPNMPPCPNAGNEYYSEVRDYTVTIIGAVSAISGPSSVCLGSTVTLSDATSGGMWSSSSPSVASVGSGTGIVTGVAIGTATITYTSGGAYATYAVTVSGGMPGITGPSTICIGPAVTFSDATTGGTWSCSTPAILTIVPATGVATGISAGATHISYTLSTGCTSVYSVTVDTLATPVSGSSGLCEGGHDSLTGVSGGTWSVAPVTVATISPTGILYGVTSGVAIVTYSEPGGCTATMVVTVDITPALITVPGAVCPGNSILLSDAVTGGLWSSSDAAIATASSLTGVVTGVAPGTVTISYSTGSGCTTTALVTVNTAPAIITGPNTVCPGDSILLYDATTGGLWSSSATAIATAGSATGSVIGVTTGTAAISYAIGSGCPATYGITVFAAPAPITGATGICQGNSSLLSDASVGGTWGSSAAGIADISSSTGLVNGIMPGTAVISYTLSFGCIATTVFTVDSLPTVIAASLANCGGLYNLTGSGTGAAYLWLPATGLSCTTCSNPVAAISATTIYTLTGTGISGCSSTDTVTVNGNRVSGFISLTAATTDTLKVWLIQFNPTDSTLTAEDSVLTCMDSGAPYYEFDNEPAGNYLVKAKLLSSIPGTSGYIPTYGLSNPHWDTATTITHISATDTQHISMIYGTVPAGPGFIGGLISSGAGRETSGVIPAVGMLVFLEDATNNVLTYTYTDATGAYSFGGLANGSYIVYPEAYKYYTTPSAIITLSAATDTMGAIDFKQHTTYGTITPAPATTGSNALSVNGNITLYPNPTTDKLTIIQSTNQQFNQFTITNSIGQEMITLPIAIGTKETQVNISALPPGVYYITFRGDNGPDSYREVQKFVKM